MPLLLAAVCALAPGCQRTLDDGVWRLTIDPAPGSLDTCNLLPAEGTITEGLLVTTGDEVRYVASFFGLQEPLYMVGRYKKLIAGEPDEFTLYGSVGNELLTVDGAPCVVRFGQVQLDASLDEIGFHGELSAHHELNTNQDPRCPLSCDLVTAYRAELIGK